MLLFMCCHPALTPPSAIALTLRAVGGLTTARDRRTRSSSPKRRWRSGSAARSRASRRRRFRSTCRPTRSAPSDSSAVLHVLYLIFNEGYASSSGAELQRTDLSNEAIRLTRMLHALLPNDGEVAGLLALMLLTDARRAARTGAERRADSARRAGSHAVGSSADRRRRRARLATRCRAARSARTSCRRRSPRVHDEAARVEDTDWPQILALYGVLERMSDNPMVSLNRAIAAAMVARSGGGLELLSRSGRRRAHRGPLSSRRGARPPVREVGRSRARHRALPRRGGAHGEHPGAELSPRQGRSASRPARR